jgi:hypothetical protein
MGRCELCRERLRIVSWMRCAVRRKRVPHISHVQPEVLGERPLRWLCPACEAHCRAHIVILRRVLAVRLQPAGTDPIRDAPLRRAEHQEDCIVLQRSSRVGARERQNAIRGGLGGRTRLLADEPAQALLAEDG